MSKCTLLKDTAKVGVNRVLSVTHPFHILTLLWEAEEKERGEEEAIDDGHGGSFAL